MRIRKNRRIICNRYLLFIQKKPKKFDILYGNIMLNLTFFVIQKYHLGRYTFNLGSEQVTIQAARDARVIIGFDLNIT